MTRGRFVFGFCPKFRLNVQLLKDPFVNRPWLDADNAKFICSLVINCWKGEERDAGVWT